MQRVHANGPCAKYFDHARLLCRTGEDVIGVGKKDLGQQVAESDVRERAAILSRMVVVLRLANC